MPPWFATEEFHGVFRNERALTQDEIDIIVRWANTGAKRGREEDAPAPVKLADEDWWLGEPDLIVQLPEPIWVGDDVTGRAFADPGRARHLRCDHAAGRVVRRAGLAEGGRGELDDVQDVDDRVGVEVKAVPVLRVDALLRAEGGRRELDDVQDVDHLVVVEVRRPCLVLAGD